MGFEAVLTGSVHHKDKAMTSWYPPKEGNLSRGTAWRLRGQVSLDVLGHEAFVSFGISARTAEKGLPGRCFS